MLHSLTITRGVLVLVALGMLTACEVKKPESTAFMHRGPESLIDVSSEVVTLNIATQKDLSDLRKWIASDAPTRAELQCDVGTRICRDALKMLEKKGVAISTLPSPANSVTLVYERILARDCKQRYRDQRTSLYNEPSKSFGCATSANVVQQVSDKSVFVNPALSDTPSAVNAVNAIHRSNVPRSQITQPYNVADPLTNSAGTR